MLKLVVMDTALEEHGLDELCGDARCKAVHSSAEFQHEIQDASAALVHSSDEWVSPGPAVAAVVAEKPVILYSGAGEDWELVRQLSAHGRLDPVIRTYHVHDLARRLRKALTTGDLSPLLSPGHMDQVLGLLRHFWVVGLQWEMDGSRDIREDLAACKSARELLSQVCESEDPPQNPWDSGQARWGTQQLMVHSVYRQFEACEKPEQLYEKLSELRNCLMAWACAADE